MTRLQKESRYTHKNLVNKREEKSLRMKLLRYVMAVGFVLSPWLGGEAYAAGIERIDNITLPNSDVKQAYFTGNDGNIAHIYAEKAHGDVGLNRFKTFNVVNGQIANMHFKTSSTDTNHLNTLVNTVQDRISISGTVNGIRNGKIGGNLYFVSPKGMIVGSTGVINAGSLTMVAKTVDISTADQASTYVTNGWGPPDSETSIYIHGRINTETGIDLQTETVNITKDGSPNPHLLTGVVFKDIVNTETYANIETYSITERRLDLTKDANGNISIINPVNKEKIGSKEVTSSGDGMINIRAKTDAGGNVFSGAFELTDGSIDAIGELKMEIGEDLTINSSSSIKANKITMSNNNGNIKNDGIIEGLSNVTIHVLGTDNKFFVEDLEGNEYGTNCLVNRGTIKSTGGGISLYGKNGISNYGTIEASGEINMTALNGVVNQGKIKSNNSNVSFVVGREFFNVAKNDTYNIATYVPHNLTYLKNNIDVLIEAGGNVQISYTDKTTGTIGKNPNDTDTVTYAPIGIYNSSTMKSGTAISATGGAAGNGSGNIWLTSSYDITNKGTMEAGRQITLNARDFLHNYGLIQGVTYLDIKSIMGYVYNHGIDNDGNKMDQPGRIIAKGGNIDLSSGQADLQIDKDTDGQKKELYRKFTPIIIEGKVEATSALNNKDNETNQGNINITAHLGDIYINGGTIETIEGPSGEVESVEGNVSLNAAQNITIGFQTERADADDPTTDGANLHNDKEREYYKPKYTDGKLVNGTAAQITGSNITLTSSSNENNYILISNAKTGSNTLTASDAITINTDSMNIVGSTFNAKTLAASGDLALTGGNITTSNVTSGGVLNIVGGTVSDNSSLVLNGSGDISIDTLAGNDVILTVGNGGKVNVNNITVGSSLQLQGDNITVNNINRSSNAAGALNVGVSGIDGANSTAQGDVKLNIDGNVVFSNMNVTNANVQATGTLEVEKLHVEGNATFLSGATTVNVYGEGVTSAPNDDKAVQSKGDGINSWFSLKIDGNGVQTSYVGVESEEPINEHVVQTVSKLLDNVPSLPSTERYGDMADVSGRTDLIVSADNPSGDTNQGNETVVKQDDGALNIKEDKAEHKGDKKEDKIDNKEDKKGDKIERKEDKEEEKKERKEKKEEDKIDNKEDKKGDKIERKEDKEEGEIERKEDKEEAKIERKEDKKEDKEDKEDKEEEKEADKKE